ncbi:MAG: hypothetical protein QW052_06200 [Candidatus Nitrosocaldaceae archaeon]
MEGGIKVGIGGYEEEISNLIEDIRRLKGGLSAILDYIIIDEEKIKKLALVIKDIQDEMGRVVKRGEYERKEGEQDYWIELLWGEYNGLKEEMERLIWGLESKDEEIERYLYKEVMNREEVEEKIDRIWESINKIWEDIKRLKEYSLKHHERIKKIEEKIKG